jgi:hypothetical protein
MSTAGDDNTSIVQILVLTQQVPPPNLMSKLTISTRVCNCYQEHQNFGLRQQLSMKYLPPTFLYVVQNKILGFDHDLAAYT